AFRARLPTHALVARAHGGRRTRAGRAFVSRARRRCRSRPRRPDRPMTSLRTSLRRAAPVGAAWMLAASPWSAIATPSQDEVGELPGIDRARIVVPSAELDGQVVSIREVDSRLAPTEALSGVERHWRAQGGETLL